MQAFQNQARVNDALYRRVETLAVQVETLAVQVAPRLQSSAASASTLGHTLLQSATREEMLCNTPAAVTEAMHWLTRAGESGKKLEAASQPESRLLEKKLGDDDDVQKIFSAMLSTQPSVQLRVHDVHNKSSVCGGWKPDVVVSVGRDPLPSSTVLVLDLKRQDGAYNCATHMHQVRGSSSHTRVHGRSVLHVTPSAAVRPSLQRCLNGVVLRSSPPTAWL